ncbi:metallophosphoesterase [Enterovibrio sp. FF113]|uniref:metallophosphoesterase family protein n=1 Tax=Enterovibrio sp. FF113 TaxID=3230010 RepID=UPI00352CF04C
MGSPKLAIRFRNVGVDTIEEHQSLIGSIGSVYWGWWKKAFEDVCSDTFSSLEYGDEIYIFNNDEKKCHIGVVARASLEGIPSEDAIFIPEYYRGNRDKVAGWFRFTEIKECDYDFSIGSEFGEHTLIQLVGRKKELGESIKKIDAKDRSVILQFSDLHFGDDYAFGMESSLDIYTGDKCKLSEAICSDIEGLGLRNEIAAILVTGDLTTKANWSDSVKSEINLFFKKLRDFFGLKKEQVIVCPGNHDFHRIDGGVVPPVQQYESQIEYEHETSYRAFIQQLNKKLIDSPIDTVEILKLKNVDVALCTLNSCKVSSTKFTEYGYVGDRGLTALRALQKISEPRTFKMMALHHHLLPINPVEHLSEKISMTLDATILLDTASEVGVKLAIHGHQHTPALIKFDKKFSVDDRDKKPVTVVSSGSTSVHHGRRIDGIVNCYSLINFKPDGADLEVRKLHHGRIFGGTLYKERIGYE